MLDKLPVAELEQGLTTLPTLPLEVLSDRRLQRVVPLAVRNILASETLVALHHAAQGLLPLLVIHPSRWRSAWYVWYYAAQSVLRARRHE